LSYRSYSERHCAKVQKLLKNIFAAFLLCDWLATIIIFQWQLSVCRWFGDDVAAVQPEAEGLGAGCGQ